MGLKRWRNWRKWGDKFKFGEKLDLINDDEIYEKKGREGSGYDKF